MGFWSFLLLVILILAGVMLYHRLQKIEREIRAELEEKAEKAAEKAAYSPSDVRPLAPVQEPKTPANSVGVKPTKVEKLLLAAVKAQPGLMQTTLYKQIPGQSPKVLQELLRKMDQAGKIKREKAKGSYQVFPG